MGASDSWARIAAAVPQDERARREGPFWQALAHSWRWHTVIDAGCGAGFHLRLLHRLGVRAVGFDRFAGALPSVSVAPLVIADLAHPALHAATFDAALCLGNTFSLLPSRAGQGEALAALAELVKPGGNVIIQGEDAAALVGAAPVARTRALPDGRTHLRIFERRGARVRMLTGVVAPAGDVGLEAVTLLPTSAARLVARGRALGLQQIAFPAQPPAGGAATWWLALRRG